MNIICFLGTTFIPNARNPTFVTSNFDTPFTVVLPSPAVPRSLWLTDVIFQVWWYSLESYLWHLLHDGTAPPIVKLGAVFPQAYQVNTPAVTVVVQSVPPHLVFWQLLRSCIAPTPSEIITEHFSWQTDRRTDFWNDLQPIDISMSKE